MCFRPASKLAVEILQSIGRSNRFPHGTREFIEGQQLITGLTATHYASADEEFRKAHEHYRHQRYGEAVNECLKSLESILKVICKKRQWPLKNTDTANALFQIVFERNLVPDYLQSQFTSLRAVGSVPLPVEIRMA